jgi:hypothetical protein
VTNKTDICNRALAAAHARSKISNISTDTSEEARVCNLFYDMTLAHLIRSARWNFSRDRANLVLSGTPNTGSWGYRYALPSNCLRPWYLEGFYGFTIAGTNLLTNVASTESPVLVFGKVIDNPDNWDASFTMAMVYALAAHICGPLTGKVRQAQTLVGMANGLIQSARVDSANEGYTYAQTQAPWIAARTLPAEFEIDSRAPYFYPDGALFAGVEM